MVCDVTGVNILLSLLIPFIILIICPSLRLQILNVWKCTFTFFTFHFTFLSEFPHLILIFVRNICKLWLLKYFNNNKYWKMKHTIWIHILKLDQLLRTFIHWKWNLSSGCKVQISRQFWRKNIIIEHAILDAYYITLTRKYFRKFKNQWNLPQGKGFSSTNLKYFLSELIHPYTK